MPDDDNDDDDNNNDGVHNMLLECQDCSSSRYASIDEVGFSIWRHTFKMVAMTSCCHLVNEHEASARRLCSSVRQFQPEKRI